MSESAFSLLFSRIGTVSYSDQLSKAFLVRKDGRQASQEARTELADYVQERKERNKWVTRGIDFVDVIPKSASGKVLRRMLNDQVARADQGKKTRDDVKEKAKL